MAVSVVAGLAAAGSAAVGGAVLAGAVSGLAIGWGVAAAAFAIGAGLSMVGRALVPKPKVNTAASLAGLTTTVREPATSKKLIYGRTRIGGTIVYVDTTGTDNEYLHFVVVLAGHEIDAYEAVYFNDEKVWQGTYQSGWGSYARIRFYKGDQTTADSVLVSESTPWTSNHILNGNAYMYVRLKYDADQFPNGIPNISAIVRGKKIYDPRQDSTSTHYDPSVGVNTHRVNDASTWTWSQNPALAVRDYLVDTQYGLGEAASAINSAALVTAADYCDVDTDSNSDPIPALQINGVVDTANSRKENIDSMLSAMGGMLVYSGGQYYVRAAQYLTPSVTIDETMMVGQIQVQTRQSRRSQYNGVKGVFLSKEKNYVVADYPAQISSTYATDDGDPIYLDMPLPFVTDNEQAQRLAKIGLLKSRQQTVITVPLNLSGLKFKAGDFIYIDNDKLGWDGKAFEVLDYGIAVDNDGSIRVDVRCIETAASIYNWLSNDAADFLSGGELTLYDGKTTQPPTSLTATESTRINSDGAVIPTIELGWTAAADAFVDHYEVEWKQSTASTYKTVNTVGTEYEIPVPVVGVTYNTRVRAVNSLGVRSTYATANVTMGGDTTAPASPTSPGTSADVHTLVVSWTNPSDLDLSYIEVKRNSVNTEGTATVVGRSSGTSFVDGPFTVATTYYYWVRAVDNSGNASAWVSASSATTVAVAENDIADGAVTIDKFGTGLEPVQVVSSLPGTATAGQMAFLTTDNKLYRYNGTAWTAAVPVGDVTGAGDLAALDTITLTYVTDAGDVAALDSISETYIDDNSITTVKINAQAVTAAKIQANTITAAQIAANTITANEIAANTITANQIAANTITSNEIAANTITAGEIAAGTITADELAANAVTGQIFDASSYLRAGSGDNSAVMSGRSIDEYAFWAGKGFETDGGPSGADAPFRVTRDGKVIMTNFALYSEAGTKLFDSQDGLLALPQTAVAQASGSLVPQVSEELTSGTDTFTVTLSSTQTITANFAYPVGALFYSGTSLTDAQNNVSSAFAVTLEYSTDSGSTWNTFGSTQNFSKVTSGTPTSSQYLVVANSFTVSIIYGATPTTVYVASLQSNRGAIDEGMTLVGSTSQSLAAGTYLVRMVFSATGGSGSGAPSTTKTREVRLTTSGAGFTVSDGTVSDGVGTSATTGWVLSNFVEKTESDNVTINGTLTLGGDLVVNGTTTTINSTTLTVNDKNIVLADGAANAAAADGAGITIDGASTGLTYRSGWDRLHFDKSLVIGGGTANITSGPNSTVSSNLSGFAEVRIDEGASTYPQASGVVFHHVNVATAKLEYSSASTTSGTFGFDSDDASFGIAINGTQFIDQARNLSNLGTIQNGSVWINDGTAYNNYNENIRLFDPSGAAVSVIAFGASGTSGVPRNSILSYQGSNGFQFRASSTVLLKMTTSNVDSKVNFAVNGTNVINTSQELININSLSMPTSHSVTKVNLYGDGSGAGDAHSIGTEPYYTIFGPTANGWDSGLIGYKFYSNNGNLVAQLGTGASTGGNKDATFYGAVTASGVVTATGGNSTNWNTAYGWGNHASEGYIGTDGTVLTTTSRVFATVQNTGTGTGDYAEMHIRNDAGTDLVLGSIGSNYSDSSWAGSRYVYSTGGDLRLKADVNLILYSGGRTNSQIALTADTNQNVYIHKDLEIGGELNNDVFVRDGKITVKRGTGLTTTIIADDSSANGRAQLLLDSHYSDMIIASRNANSNSHGSTLTFATQSTSTANYRKWVIGQGQYQLDADCLAFAYGADQQNPHDILGPQNANAMVLFDAGLTRAIFRSSVEIIRTASSFNGTVQSFRVAGASGNGSITIDSNGAGQQYPYLTYAQGGVAKWEIGADGANAGNLYINSNPQVGAASASMYLTRSGNLVGINTTDPKVRLHVSGSRAAIVSTDASYGQLRIGNTNNDETSIAFMPGLTESTIGNSSPTATRKWVMGPGAFVTGTDKFGIGNEVGSGIISFTEAGRVGIKQMAPSYMLHVGNNGGSPHAFMDGNFSVTTDVGDHGRIYFNDANFGIGAGNCGTGKDDLYLWSYGAGAGRGIRFLSTTGATGGNHPTSGFYTNMVIDGATGDVEVSRGDLTLTNGLATANNFRANGGTAEPYSGAIFSNVFKGIGTNRTVYFDGYGSGGTSVWWGVGSNPHAALDSVDGTLDIWINGSDNLWRNICDFTAGGLNITYGGLSRNGTQYIRSDNGHLVTQNSATIGTRTGTTTFNPNTSGISAAQCGEVRSASTTSGPGLAFHYEGVSTRWLHLQSDGVLRCVIPSTETTGGYRNAVFQAETLICGGGPTAGNYNEGLRILDASNNYSVIAFGASGVYGVPNWSLLKNPSNYFEIRAGHTVVLGSDTSGNFTARGNVTAYGSPSDIRLKENIEAIPSALAKVKALRGVTFNYKADGSRSTGLIAQDLLKVLPEVVYEHKPFGEGEARYAVRYGQIAGLLVEAIKEQQSEIDELKQLIKELINGYSKDD